MTATATHRRAALRTRVDGRPRTRHSLRARLVVAVMLLLATVCAVVGLATAIALRHFMLNQLDDDLVSAGGRFVAIQNGAGPGGPNHPDDRGGHGADADVGADFLGPAQAPRTVGATIVAGQVTDAVVTDRGGSVLQVPAEALATLAAVPTNGHPVSEDLGDLGTYRLLASVDGSGTVLVTGLPQADVDHLTQLLVVAESIVVVLALTGAGVVGAIAVRRELRPLEQVAETAGRVSALQLDSGEVELLERVPAAHTDPGTEVGQVGAALNRMLDNVAAALDARHASEVQLRQFVADASHELRTPLAAIRGYAELTARDRTLPPTVAHSLSRITSQAERMSTLVEDLLLLARLDAGRPLERAPVDLTRLVLDAVSDAGAAGPGHRWRLDLPPEPVVVLGDTLRLTQVVTNLLANARTHTPAGTEVTVGLRTPTDPADPADRAVLVTVSDTGPGIPPALAAHVFERFARGDGSRSRDRGSTGLGLAIVQAVVDAHGGTVTVASRPGRTTFTVRLPAPALPVPDGKTIPLPALATP
ncbi:HAMP domain-containing sensor histidine kinase [Pseudonocardia sp. NPDC049154]|uniref:sensor histidine kinase n=1 Tax=Pseudonocardia sp. NPDC049154 TaxID=3155501 RepID=UPI003400294E